MHLFHIPECSIQNRNMHISVLNGAFWDMEQVHSGISELGQLLGTKQKHTENGARPFTYTRRDYRATHVFSEDHLAMFLYWIDPQMMSFKMTPHSLCFAVMVTSSTDVTPSSSVTVRRNRNSPFVKWEAVATARSLFSIVTPVGPLKE